MISWTGWARIFPCSHGSDRIQGSTPSLCSVVSRNAVSQLSVPGGADRFQPPKKIDSPVRDNANDRSLAALARTRKTVPENLHLRRLQPALVQALDEDILALAVCPKASRPDDQTVSQQQNKNRMNKEDRPGGFQTKEPVKHPKSTRDARVRNAAPTGSPTVGCQRSNCYARSAARAGLGEPADGR